MKRALLLVALALLGCRHAPVGQLYAIVDAGAPPALLKIGLPSGAAQPVQLTDNTGMFSAIVDDAGNLHTTGGGGGGGGSVTQGTNPWVTTVINDGGNPLPVNVIAGGGSNASVGATAAAVPASATYCGGNQGGNLVGMPAGNASAPFSVTFPSAQAVTLASTTLTGTQNSRTFCGACLTAIAKNSPGTLYAVCGVNRSGSAAYLQTFNQTTAPTSGVTAPTDQDVVVAGGETCIDTSTFGQFGIAYGTGVTAAMSTTNGVYTAGTAANYDIKVVWQ